MKKGVALLRESRMVYITRRGNGSRAAKNEREKLMNANEITGATKIIIAEYLVKNMTVENGYSKYIREDAKIWKGGEKVRIYMARKDYIEINEDGSLIIKGMCYRAGPELRKDGFAPTAI